MLIKSFPELDNIHAIAVPLPVQKQLITANVYVVGSDPATLIDTGPKMPGFLDLIRQQLNRAGLDFKDVTRIIATHGHMDHVGLATQIRRAAGHPVEVFIHPEDLRLVSKESFRDNRWSKKADELMTWVGVPVGEISKIKHITPNPFIEVEKFRLQNPEYQSLSAFIDSWEGLARIDVR